MNSLNIQQGSTVEYVSTDLIKKLYDVAISVSEPLEGELDLALLSGYISVGKSYELYVKYLAGTVFYKSTGSIHNNPSGRFLNLRIDVTEDYYIPFEDSNVESVLKANNISSDGVGITHTDAAAVTAFNTMFKNNTDITSFDELLYFTNYTKVGLAGSMSYGTEGEFSGCSSLESIDLRNVDWIDGKFYGCTSLREVKNFNGRGIISYLAYGNQFVNCTSLESINLSNCMLIGKDAFQGCTSLNSIGNLNNLIYAEDGAFVKCSNLQIDVNIPRLRTVGISNTPIGVFVDSNINSWNNGNYTPAYMFLSSGITSISNLGKCGSIADGYGYLYLTWNAGFASNCPNLTTVKLPKEMTYIGSYAFYGCPNLTSVKQYVDSIDDWVEGETPAVGNLTGITHFGSYCFTNCPNLTLTTADIAGAVVLLGDAFNGSTITGTLSLPSLTTLGESAFKNTKITSVTDLGSITSIPNSCFKGCTSITSVTLPSRCTSIGQDGFADCTNLSNVTLPSTCITLQQGAFYNSGNGTGTIDTSNITTMGTYSFHKSKFKGAIDMSNVTTFGNSILDDCRFTNLIIPWSTALIIHNTFNNFNCLSNAYCIKTIDTDFTLWTVSPLFMGYRDLLPFVLYLPNVINMISRNSIFGGQNGTSKMYQIYMPALLSIRDTLYRGGGYGMFGSSRHSIDIDLVYFKDLSDFSDNFIIYSNTSAVIINNTTPPTGYDLENNIITNVAFGRTLSTEYNIYVPDSALSTYRVAWPFYTKTSNGITVEYIHGISELNNGIIYATESDWTAAGKPAGLIAEYLGLNTADLATFVSANNLTYWTNPNA